MRWTHRKKDQGLHRVVPHWSMLGCEYLPRQFLFRYRPSESILPGEQLPFSIWVNRPTIHSPGSSSHSWYLTSVIAPGTFDQTGPLHCPTYLRHRFFDCHYSWCWHCYKCNDLWRGIIGTATALVAFRQTFGTSDLTTSIYRAPRHLSIVRRWMDLRFLGPSLRITRRACPAIHP